MRKTPSFILLIFCLFLSLPGCTSLPVFLRHQPLEIAKAWVSNTASIEIEQAYHGPGVVFIQFKGILPDSEQERIFCVKADWGKLDIVPGALRENQVVSLELMEQKKFLKSVQKLDRLKTFSRNDWQDFRNKLAHEVTPSRRLSGNLVKMADEQMVFYYDAKDELKIVDLKKKPKDVVIKKVLGQKEFSEMLIGVLKDFLKEKNLSVKEVLFVARSEDANERLFYYVDISKKLILNLKILPSDNQAGKDNFFKKSWKTADHLILESHVFGVARKPISSLFRLFVFSKDTAYDIIKPTSLVMFEKKKVPAYYQGPPMDLDAFEKELDQLVGRRKDKGQMKFLIGGDEFFPRLVDVLLNAKKSIQIRIFIFDNDDYGVEIADILKLKSKEGVDVKVLLDGMGQLMGEGKIPADLPPSFFPPDSMAQYLLNDSNVEVRIRSNAWFKADHTKTIVVDNKICFTGGMNIGREYRYDWHDMMVEMTGPVIHEITRDFKLAWAHAGFFGDFGYFMRKMFSFSPKRDGGGHKIRLLYTRLNNPQIFRAQLAAIKAAKKYIYINNAYFSDNAILYELIKARRRGVDVRVILPIHGNHEIMNASNVVTANVMFRNGIKVYFYPGMSHIKAAVYDGWLCTGSANFDRLSLIDNLELNIATSDRDTVDRLNRKLFQHDFAKSRLMEKPLVSGWREWFSSILAERL